MDISEKDADRSDLAWEEIKTEHIVQDEWIDFRRSAFRFPDGSVFAPYYNYSRRDYVVIVASDTEGRYLCVRQFRQGVREVTTEFPAGGIERKDGREYAVRSGDMKESATKHTPEAFLPADGETKESPAKTPAASRTEIPKAGHSDAEDALEAAKRELREETGYVSKDWTYLLTVPSNATIADNYAYIFKAENCRKVGAQELDDTEFLNVETHTAEEIEALIRSGKFQQAVHIMAWLLAER